MSPKLATSAPVLVLQIIHCAWDKSARGGKLAEARNRIPLSLLLRFPEHEFQGQVLAHITRWGDRNKFITAISEKCEFPAGGKHVYRGARVALQGDSAMLDFIQEDWQGCPPFPEFSLGSRLNPARIGGGEMVRMRWNGQFSHIDTGEWWYESVTLNARVCERPDVTRNLFLSKQPDVKIEKLRRLR